MQANDLITKFTHTCVYRKEVDYSSAKSVRQYSRSDGALRSIAAAIDAEGSQAIDGFSQLLTCQDRGVRLNCAWMIIHNTHFSAQNAEAAIAVIKNEEDRLISDAFLTEEWYCGRADTVYLREWYALNKISFPPVLTAQAGEPSRIEEFVFQAYFTMLPRLTAKLSARKNQAIVATDAIAMQILKEHTSMTDTFASLLRHTDYCVLRFIDADTALYAGDAIEVIKKGLQMNELLYYGQKHWL